MSVEVDKSFVQQYKANVEMLSQQKGSRLMHAVRVEPLNAEFGFFDQVGATEAEEVTGRHQDTPLISTPHDRRRVSMKDYDWADLIDKQDRVKMLIDPTGPYTVNAVWAFGRKKDDVIINAAFGTAYTGKTGATTVAFPTSTNVVAVDEHSYDAGSGNTGLTISKLLTAKEIFGGYDVDEDEEFYIACSQRQINDLLATTQVGSRDYNDVLALKEGKLNTYMGFTFIRTQRLLTDSNSYRRVMAWAKSGLLLAVGEEITIDVGPRRDKRMATQVYVNMTIGATRMEEKKMVEIKCAES